MQDGPSLSRLPDQGSPSRPNEGRDCREEFARRFRRWLLVMGTWPFWGFAMAVGAGHLGNRILGRQDELPNAWSFAAWAASWLLAVFVRWNTRCPACGVRFRLTDYRPKHCQCGALLNDRHKNGPWW